MTYQEFLRGKIIVAPDSGIELNYESFKDGISYLKAADEEASAPTLFEIVEQEESHA